MDIYINDQKLENEENKKQFFYRTVNLWTNGGICHMIPEFPPRSYDIVKVKKDSLIRFDFGDNIPTQIKVKLDESNYYDNDELLFAMQCKNIFSSESEKELSEKYVDLVLKKSQLEEEIFEVKSKLELVGKLKEVSRHTYKLPLYLRKNMVYECSVVLEWRTQERYQTSLVNFKFELDYENVSLSSESFKKLYDVEGEQGILNHMKRNL